MSDIFDVESGARENVCFLRCFLGEREVVDFFDVPKLRSFLFFWSRRSLDERVWVTFPLGVKSGGRLLLLVRRFADGRGGLLLLSTSKVGLVCFVAEAFFGRGGVEDFLFSTSKVAVLYSCC